MTSLSLTSPRKPTTAQLERFRVHGLALTDDLRAFLVEAETRERCIWCNAVQVDSESHAEGCWIPTLTDCLDDVTGVP